MATSSLHLALPINLDAMVRQWLLADAPTFDVGGFVVGAQVRTARLLAKAPGVLAGRPFAQAVFDAVGDLKVTWSMDDGQTISHEQAAAKTCIAIVTGPAKKILLAERTALNILSRASGVATRSRAMVNLVRNAKWYGHVAATRKTTPGFALVEKYAVLVGGASTHRMDLSQMCMLKDNHVWSVGSITAAVRRAQTIAGFSQKIEVEARDLAEALEAADAGADIVMLDNMTGEQLKKSAAALKTRFPHVIIEASGGITEATIVNYLSPAVDVISLGMLTHGYEPLDFSLKIDRDAKL